MAVKRMKINQKKAIRYKYYRILKRKHKKVRKIYMDQHPLFHLVTIITNFFKKQLLCLRRKKD